MVSEKGPMTLIVCRLGCFGSAPWAFRHGKRSISAKIEDHGWLMAFQSRKVDVLPGDALKCLVTVENSYGHDNELIEEKITVTKVLSVAPAYASAHGLTLLPVHGGGLV